VEKKPITSLVGCTIAYGGSAAQALVLAKSFLKFHPGAQFALFFLHPIETEIAIPNAFVLGPRDLNLPVGEEWRLPMVLSAREITALLKPALLQTLLEKRGAAAAAYFECSTVLFGSLADSELPSAESPILATEQIENENRDFGRSFIAARAGTHVDLSAWRDRVSEEYVIPRPLTPGEDRLEILERSFAAVPHTTVRSAGFACSYANLDPKTFQIGSDGYKVAGSPLRSFDFRGYDPDRPHLLSRYQGLEPRILLSECPVLARLCDEYRENLLRNATGRSSRASSFDTMASGLRIDERMRRLYSDALETFRRDGTPEPPSPFGPQGEEGFLRWLNEPLTSSGPTITRYMLSVLDDRPDVREVVRDPLGADAAAFRHWYQLFGRHELELPSVVAPDDVTADTFAGSEAKVPRTSPVNVAGYFRAELGLGSAARSILSALEAANIPFNTISFGATANRQDHPFKERSAHGAPADINLICVNPDQFPRFAEETGPELRQGRYTIGVWFWEVEDFPRLFHGAFNYVDEVWVASDFMRETFLKVSPKPVFKYRLPIEAPRIDPRLSRADLGLPATFTFLFSFDFFSVLERKNPLGLIKAFTEAFPNGSGPALVIKTINGDKRLLEMEKLRYAARGRSDIILKDGYLSPIETSTLTALSDCYVSLHRSEGFGLTMAEAMALGKPTIATAYSGNLDFMTPENSYLCPYRLCPVGLERDPYPAASQWADPETEAVVRLLREVFTNRDAAKLRGERAAQDIRALRFPALAGSIIQERLATIRTRRRTGLHRTAEFLEDIIDELQAKKTPPYDPESSGPAGQVSY
jgi:glycosyltransferase involved in cell wall biosynthesis